MEEKKRTKNSERVCIGLDWFCFSILHCPLSGDSMETVYYKTKYITKQNYY